MNTLFQNSDKTAILSSAVYTDTKLLDACIKYTDPLLVKKPTIVVFGKECGQPRDVGFFSDTSTGYNYSKKTMMPQPLNSDLKSLLESVNNEFKSQYNGILINKYENGECYITAHSDDEKSLDDKGILTLSYGQPRKFRIRDKSTKKIVYETDTVHSSFLLMSGDFQSLYTHEIPKQLRVKECRYSFTFRVHKI
jgi:alkylated DNA repair dioxygenase AlkB